MSDPVAPRLTKKQRKSQAHRDRGKLRRAQLSSIVDNGLPGENDTAVTDEDVGDRDHDDGEDDGLSSLKSKLGLQSPAKRGRDDDEMTDRPPNKVQRLDNEEATSETDAAKPAKTKKKKRYILFVGEHAGYCNRPSLNDAAARQPCLYNDH